MVVDTIQFHESQDAFIREKEYKEIDSNEYYLDDEQIASLFSDTTDI
ncbi:MAG: hypothetical protein WCJ39_01300 [bacterium]